MKYIELQEAFELELNVLDNAFEKPMSSDTEWWLNRGLEKFYKTRYTGYNAKRHGFEQTQKRIDDLRTLIKTKTYSSEEISSNGNVYTVTLPTDYIFLLGNTVNILPKNSNDCWSKNSNNEYIPVLTDTIEVTIDTIDQQMSNSLSEYKLKYCKARPLKLIEDKYINLYTDGNYKVDSYKVTYLRKPDKINISLNPALEYTDMPEHTHAEIVKIAAQMYLENKADKRINTHNAETLEME